MIDVIKLTQIPVLQVLSERWAAVWTWSEEWKEKLNQALVDWRKLREEETVLLSWLSSKEQTMDVIGQTDITDDEQVKMHLNLLEVLYDNNYFMRNENIIRLINLVVA